MFNFCINVESDENVSCPKSKIVCVAEGLGITVCFICKLVFLKFGCFGLKHYWKHKCVHILVVVAISPFIFYWLNVQLYCQTALCNLYLVFKHWCLKKWYFLFV